MAALLWFSLFLISSTTILVNAGRSRRSPIVTDELARPNDFPWAVAIMSGSTGNYVCSGGIIGEKFILSSAHCFIKDEGGHLKIKRYTVYAGTINYMAASSEKGAVTRKVYKVYASNDYDTHTFTSDIAILKLYDDLNIQRNNLRKLDLPSKPENLIGKRAVVAAFGLYEHPARGTGKIKTDGKSDGRLRCANIQIIEKTRAYDEANFKLRSDHVLGLMRKDSKEVYGMCYGDSGSSLVELPSTVIGIFMSVYDHYCNGTIAPGVFVDVGQHLTLIRNVMSGNITGDISLRKCKPSRPAGEVAESSKRRKTNPHN